jgi:ribosome-binding protein aMBF1 (putative translation factor)
MNNDRFAKYRQIGQSITYYRKKRGVSRQELAARINSSEEQLREIEIYGSDIAAALKSPWTGKSMDILFAIADSLEMEAVVFFLPVSEENFEKYRTDKPD